MKLKNNNLVFLILDSKYLKFCFIKIKITKTKNEKGTL